MSLRQTSTSTTANETTQQVLMKQRQRILGNIIKNNEKPWGVKTQELRDLLQPGKPHYDLFKEPQYQETVLYYVNQLREKFLDSIEKTRQQAEEARKIEAQRRVERNAFLQNIQYIQDPVARLAAYKRVIDRTEGQDLFNDIQFVVQDANQASNDIAATLRAGIKDALAAITDPVQKRQEMALVVDIRNILKNQPGFNYLGLFVRDRSENEMKVTKEYAEIADQLIEDFLKECEDVKTQQEKINTLNVTIMLCSSYLSSRSPQEGESIEDKKDALREKVYWRLLQLSPTPVAQRCVKNQFMIGWMLSVAQDTTAAQRRVKHQFIIDWMLSVAQDTVEKIKALQEAAQSPLFQDSNQLQFLNAELESLRVIESTVAEEKARQQAEEVKKKEEAQRVVEENEFLQGVQQTQDSIEQLRPIKEKLLRDKIQELLAMPPVAPVRQGFNTPENKFYSLSTNLPKLLYTPEPKPLNSAELTIKIKAIKETIEKLNPLYEDPEQLKTLNDELKRLENLEEEKTITVEPQLPKPYEAYDDL